jgi:hypothetical protein
MNSTRRALGQVTLFGSADSVLCSEGNPLGIRLNAATTQGSAPVVQVIAGAFMAVGAAALQVCVMAANKTKTLAREATAQRARGGVFKYTEFVDANFAGNGQMQSRTHAFTVQDGGIIV